MSFPHAKRLLLSCLILLSGIVGLVTQSGLVYAADRAVVGELWSQDG